MSGAIFALFAFFFLTYFTYTDIYRPDIFTSFIISRNIAVTGAEVAANDGVDWLNLLLAGTPIVIVLLLVWKDSKLEQFTPHDLSWQHDTCLRDAAGAEDASQTKKGSK